MDRVYVRDNIVRLSICVFTIVYLVLISSKSSYVYSEDGGSTGVRCREVQSYCGTSLAGIYNASYPNILRPLPLLERCTPCVVIIPPLI